MPSSTYRLQLHREFPLASARAIVEYLFRLGISDCYLSPVFASRPGSTHGYDVTDHNRIDADLGGRDEYERLAAEVTARGMGIVLDCVPNHMGIDPVSNPWWRDVLENGQCSAYARFFDIDWNPLKPELQGRVLLPILGRQYGHALEAGELRVVFADGRFEVHYGDHQLPINPRQATLILRPGLDRLRAEVGDDDPGLQELMSIVSALGNMPAHTDSRDEAIAERRREKEVQRSRLVRLVAETPPVRAYVDAALAEINGTPGNNASFDRLHELLEMQPYRLAYWRTASHEINYRRFFDINDLAGLRQEVPEVFEATHALLAELLKAGRVTGVRIDHPDGLFDPAGYFEQLQQLAARAWQLDGSPRRPLYVVAEKILSGDEELPPEWCVHGTTGYNFLNELNALFVDGAAARRLRRVYARFVGEAASFAEIVYRSKQLIMDTSLSSELNVLANTMDRIGEQDRRSRDFTVISMREAVGEVVACFPVYRTYVRGEGWTLRDREIVDQAIRSARDRNPALEPSVFDFVREVLLPRRPEDEPYEPGGPRPEDRRSGYPPSDEADRQRRLRTSMKLQQYTAPVQAKGVEDTAFYRYNGLLSLNEVGGEPHHFGCTPEQFHRASQRRFASWPYEMLSTSTHDTKLGEDVRARINVLSELPEEWGRESSRWRRINQANRTLVENVMHPDRNDEYRFYQALIGAWPAEQPEQADQAFVDRMKAFMTKSIKEAKLHTSWINQNRAYDDAVARFVERSLTGPTSRRFLPAMLPFQRRVAAIGTVNSLAQLVLKLATPGVPDLYQGCERWNLSLVDPDNRRPVDFDANRAMLDEIDRVLCAGDAPARSAQVRSMLDRWQDGRIKMCLTAAGLRLRREHPETFVGGEYVALETESTVQAGLVAFARVPAGGPAVIAIAPRLVARLMGAELAWPLGQAWKTSRVLLPHALARRRFRNVLTGRDVSIAHASERSWIFAGEAFEHCTVALLVETD
ncbi:MAG TPA: malto-oligosyltrehalose synthase [Vicinamibacterales bacterium]|nr:malto-oligosyltrehalose synthase [Vicinamibacterales bacterium]